jgi:hypothetical protein
MALTAEALSRHRGPFMLTGCRTVGKTKPHPESCLLAKDLERADVLDLAQSFLTDPRDTITAVFVWARSGDPYCVGKV